MARHDQDAAKPHDTDNANLKPGSPPRPATEPAGSEGSSETNKTMTDPATGKPSSEA